MGQSKKSYKKAMFVFMVILLLLPVCVFASDYRYKDILDAEALKARSEKTGYSSIQTLGNEIAATAMLSNSRLSLYFNEVNSNVWQYLYDVSNNYWGESCYHEHFAIWTPETGIMESEGFSVETPFTDPGGGAGAISAVLNSNNFKITRTITLVPGDVREFQIKYKLKNSGQSSISDVRFFQAIDFDIPTTADCTDDYSYYEASTDDIAIKDDEAFRNGIRSNIRASAHGTDFWNTEIYYDWDDGQLNGADSYGPGDPGIAKQFNIGSMSPGQEWEVILTIWFGDRIVQQGGYRVWIDKNGNGGYDDGEGIEGADVWINSEASKRGVTGSGGLISLQNIHDNDKIYAYKQLYSVNNPKGNDANFNNKREQNPYFASNGTDAVNGIMYNFVMASDIMGNDGKYYDFPGQGKNLQQAPKENGNVLIRLVHPKIEWNLVVSFQDAPSNNLLEKIKTGLKKYNEYMYNYSDGYSLIRNVVLVNQKGDGTPQWDYADIQIQNGDVWPNANIFGNRGNMKTHIHMGKKWEGDDPDEKNWYKTVGHESGHYLFGFFDEYKNGDGEKKMRETPRWTYRYEHDGSFVLWPPHSEPNEFPGNYGLMDHQYDTHEMSDPTDYFSRDLPPSVGIDLVTREYFLRNGESCWQYFKTYYTTDIKQNMNNADLAGFSDSFFDVLIKPPHTAGSYPDSNSDKRPNPTSLTHNNLNFIVWSGPATSEVLNSGNGTPEVFNATIAVIDKDGKQVPNADVWVVSGGIKSFQGTTDKDGNIKFVSLKVGQAVEVFLFGQKQQISINEVKDKITVIFPFSLATNKQTSLKTNPYIQAMNIPGVIVSAKPDESGENLSITVSSDPLNSLPAVTLAQPTGFNNVITMMDMGNGLYTGNSAYEYNTGSIEVFASGASLNQSTNAFIVHDARGGIDNAFYSYDGSLEIMFFGDSFINAGNFIIVDSYAPAPAHSALTQVGNVFSIAFSDNVSVVNHVNFSIRLSPGKLDGIDARQLKLYGWNKANKTWNAISGGENNLNYFGITLDTLQYESYALFAPMSSDTEEPDPITDLQATTGDSRWSVNLQWTAPSDNQTSSGNSIASADSTVYAYDIRYNTIPITESNWDACTPVGITPPPAVPGTTQSVVVEMPDPNSNYYFAMRSIDATGNKSPITILSAPVISQAIDTDGDGMPDLWETSNSLNPNVIDSQNDDDGDGLLNIQEYQHKTDPKDADTDNDGYMDGFEVSRGSNPSDPNSIPGNSIALHSTWNLISINSQPSDTAILNVLATVAGEFSSVWEYIDGNWRSFDPRHPTASDLTSIEPGKGYWIYMVTDDYLITNGTTANSSISLSAGWNLVGYNSVESKAAAEALASLEGKYASAWAFVDGTWKVYDPANPDASDLTTMEPGYGYWINATENCTWSLNGTQSASMTAFKTKKTLLDRVKTWFKNGGKDRKRVLEPPPMPPCFHSAK